MGLRPKPPPATRGDPIAPLRGRRAAPCAAWGRTPPCCRPPPYFTAGGVSLHLQLGAAPQAPAGHSRGPHCPTPWASPTWGCAPNPRRPLAGTPLPHSVGITYLGLRPKPPPATRGDPIAPLRGRRAAPCAAWGRTPPCCRPPPYFTAGGVSLHLQLGAAPQTAGVRGGQGNLAGIRPFRIPSRSLALFLPNLRFLPVTQRSFWRRGA